MNTTSSCHCHLFLIFSEYCTFHDTSHRQLFFQDLSFFVNLSRIIKCNIVTLQKIDNIQDYTIEFYIFFEVSCSWNFEEWDKLFSFLVLLESTYVCIISKDIPITFECSHHYLQVFYSNCSLPSIALDPSLHGNTKGRRKYMT